MCSSKMEAEPRRLRTARFDPNTDYSGSRLLSEAEQAGLGSLLFGDALPR